MQEDEFPGIDLQLRRRIERLRRRIASGASAGPSSPGPGVGIEDAGGMFDHPELAPKARKVKDRRKPAIRELDERASRLWAARSDADTDWEGGGGAVRGDGTGAQSRLRQLLDHPQLFAMSFKVWSDTCFTSTRDDV